jgi:hypothetical protein
VIALSFASKKTGGDVNLLTVLLLLTAGTKFLISIAGLGSAIVFRSRLGLLETRLRDRLATVCQRLQQSTTLYTPEHLLVRLIETTGRQAESFEQNTLRMASHINSAIDTMTTSVTGHISDAIMNKLESRLTQVLNQAEQQFLRSVQQLADESAAAGRGFKKEIETSARQFGDGVAPAGQSFAEQIIASAGRIDESRLRICVNTPTTHGSIGLTTGLDPAMTLGCGGWGGNITSDNISPKHLLNIKRLAYEIRPATAHRAEVRLKADATALPKAPSQPVTRGIPAQALAAKIDSFLASRGFKSGAPEPGTATNREPGTRNPEPPALPATPTDFVCEDDVRTAIRAGKTILIGEKTIVTPAARELGEEKKVLVQ